ncbi:hypothetical protein SRHO_G00136510 [Serrasalmus rhombeus]
MFHSPHKQPQNHKCGARSFPQDDRREPLGCKWLIGAGQPQSQRPSESFRTSRVTTTLHQKEKYPLRITKCGYGI